MKCPYCDYDLENEEINVGYKCPSCGREYSIKEMVEYIIKGPQRSEYHESIPEDTIPVVPLGFLPGHEVVKVLGPVYGLTAKSMGFGGIKCNPQH
ncbi:hypothetical protein E2P64_03630 [Candidatus Bathyarchaeota archaeon]|nr:hypothetical protein E2P64_03630 [Candidatus Bathyarchaeota archaeon]